MTFRWHDSVSVIKMQWIILELIGQCLVSLQDFC